MTFDIRFRLGLENLSVPTEIAKGAAAIATSFAIVRYRG
jgi:hypothetical protein